MSKAVNTPNETENENTAKKKLFGKIKFPNLKKKKKLIIIIAVIIVAAAAASSFFIVRHNQKSQNLPHISHHRHLQVRLFLL